MGWDVSPFSSGLAGYRLETLRTRRRVVTSDLGSLTLTRTAMHRPCQSGENDWSRAQSDIPHGYKRFP